MTDTSPADQLRAAAARLRETAEVAQAVSPATWQITDERVIRCGTGLIVADRSEADPSDDVDLPYIAAMHPGVGLALAGWFDAEATRLESAIHPDRQAEYGRHALAVARQILGEDDR